MKTEQFINCGQKLNQNASSEINVKIKDLVLTPLTCASIVNETIRTLVYNKSQIPYPYNYLTLIVQRKRKEDPKTFKNFTAERHFQVASSAADVIEDLTKNIKEEFRKGGAAVREVLILFGATPYTVKETFTIRVTNVAKGHAEDTHKVANRKNQHKVMQ